MKLFSLIAVVALGACGGAAEPAAVNHPGHGGGEVQPPHEQHGDATKVAGAEHDEHEHNFPAGVTAFHDSLAPVWHNEKPDRADKACADAPVLLEKGNAIVNAAPPAEVPADHHGAWQADAAALVASVEAVQAECAAGRAALEAKLEAMHNAFHKLVEHVGHKEHGEGHEGHGEGHEHKH